MQSHASPAVSRFIPAALILALAGWAGLAYLFRFTLPTLGPRWLFFFLGVLALTGSFLPVVAYLNRRFPSTPAPTPVIILRQSLWIGIYGPTLAWLQIGRVLSPLLALLLAIGFVLVEWLLRMREKSQWKP